MSSPQSPYLPPTHKNSRCNPFHVWGEGEISSQNVKKKAKFSLGLQRLAQGSNPGKYTKQHAVYYPSSGDQGFEPWCKLGQVHGVHHMPMQSKQKIMPPHLNFVHGALHAFITK